MKSVSVKRTVINVIITLVFAFVYFYLRLPAINLHDPAFYWFFIVIVAVFCILTIITAAGRTLAYTRDVRELVDIIKKTCLIPALVCVALVVLFIIGNLVGIPLFRAGAYSRLLTVEPGDFTAEVEEISFDQIPMLDEDSAKKLGDRKMGELAEYVSQFIVGEEYTQINYKGRPVRVTPLEYGDIIKWFNNRSAGLPAYLVIDMVTQNVEVVRLNEGMIYTTCEHFGRNLSRYLRFNYPTYMFDDATFEIDEEGTPYWVCPRIIKRIGLFNGTDIKGAVLVNAVTGETAYYEDVPNWVDRVYTAGLIIQQYDYYGEYQSGFWNSIFGQRNVTNTTTGYNYIAIGDDVYMYTGITSVVSDESNIGFILTNQRTKETRFYSIAGAEEYSARSSAEGVVQQYKYVSTFPLLLNINSQPTYFMALKDAAGLVKMYAMVNVQQYQVVATGNTVSECERNYIALLNSNGIAIKDTSGYGEVSGKVVDVKSAVVEGNTRIYVKLDSSEAYYVISVSDCEYAAILNVGDEVTLAVTALEGDLISAYDLVIVK